MYDIIDVIVKPVGYQKLLIQSIVADEIQFQPALVSVFHRRNSDELSARETVKEHLWNVHFSEYGR